MTLKPRASRPRIGKVSKATSTAFCARRRLTGSSSETTTPALVYSASITQPSGTTWYSFSRMHAPTWKRLAYHTPVFLSW